MGSRTLALLCSTLLFGCAEGADTPFQSGLGADSGSRGGDGLTDGGGGDGDRDSGTDLIADGGGGGGDGDGDSTSGDGDGVSGCSAGDSCFLDGSDCSSDADCVNQCLDDMTCGSNCVPGVDTDGDGVEDCTEVADDEAWTDPAIFNGVHGRQRNQCSASGNCGENDTLGDVLSCMGGGAAEELDQSAGWSWESNPPDSNCNGAYGFEPPWTQCDSTWQGDWRATIRLRAGHHCFELTGGTNESCAALYVEVDTPADQFGGWESLDAATAADAQTDSGPVCFTVAEGSYPIMWHYTMDNGAGGSLQLRHCFDAAVDCTPSDILPAALLQVP